MLRELEAEIMEEACRQDETTVKPVVEPLNREAKPPLAYTTYMTVIVVSTTRDCSIAAEPAGRTHMCRS